MKIQPLLAVLTLANFGLLLLLLFRPGLVEAQDAPSMLTGTGLQIVDAQGRIRASVSIEAAGMANGEAFPETVLLRLIDANGQPSVKISTSETKAGMSLVGGDDKSYVILQADGPQSSLRMVGADGQQQFAAP